MVRKFFADGVGAADAVLDAMDQAVDVFRALGAVIEDVALDPLQDFGACSRILVLAEFFAVHERELVRHAEAFGEIFRHRVLPGVLLQAADYVAARQLREKLTSGMLTALQRVDALLCATTLGPAPALASILLTGRLTPFPTAPFSVAGVPAISVCNGFAGGLPLGMQIASRPQDEATVLRIAHAYQQATTWHERRPSLDAGQARPASRTPPWVPAAMAVDPDLGHLRHRATAPLRHPAQRPGQTAARRGGAGRHGHGRPRPLMSAVPVADPDFKLVRIRLEGDVPKVVNPPSGCYFHPHCRHAQAICRTEAPAYRGSAASTSRAVISRTSRSFGASKSGVTGEEDDGDEREACRSGTSRPNRARRSGGSSTSARRRSARSGFPSC